MTFLGYGLEVISGIVLSIFVIYKLYDLLKTLAEEWEESREDINHIKATLHQINDKLDNE